MLGLSDTALSVVTGTYRLYLAVESWLDGQLLADSIPVDTASEEVDRAQSVPERVTLTVPRRDRGMSWSPVGADHPLAANGQRLRVQLGVDVGNGMVEWWTRGWFLVQDSEADGDTVNVTAVGLLGLIDEAKMVTPIQPDGTMTSALRALVEPALTVVVDDGLTDRDIPDNINFGDDRLRAVLDLVDAWPADIRVDSEGFLHAKPTTQSTVPVLSLTNGTGGTIITATGKSSREDGYNCVVAQGTTSDGAQVQGVAQVASGPRRFGGPYSPLPVPYFFSSPLLTSNGQCDAAAAAMLTRLQRTGTIGFDVEMVPHPGLEAGDVVSVTTDDYTDLLCTVEYLSLPWTANGGSQKLTVRSLT